VVVGCWSVKGGSGTTVVATALAAVLGRRDGVPAVLVDLDGDVPSVVGAPEPDGPGIADWLVADDAVGTAALDRLVRPVAEGVELLARGRRPVAGSVERTRLLAAHLEGLGRPVVVDAGVLLPPGSLEITGAEVRHTLVEAADRSWLVTRPCFLALRRALAVGRRPDGIVLVEEPGRALGRTDVEDVLGAPVVATVAADASVARAVDAGLLLARLPAVLGRALSTAA